MKEYYLEKKDPSSGLGIDRISLANLAAICEHCIDIKCTFEFIDFVTEDTTFYSLAIQLLDCLNSPEYSDRKKEIVDHMLLDIVFTINLSRARMLMEKVQQGTNIHYSYRPTRYEQKLSNLTRRLFDGLDKEGIDKDMTSYEISTYDYCKDAESKSGYILRRDEESENREVIKD